MYTYTIATRRPLPNHPGNCGPCREIAEAEVMRLRSDGLISDFAGALDLNEDVEFADGESEDGTEVRVYRAKT